MYSILRDEASINNMSVRLINRIRFIQLLFRKEALTQFDLKDKLKLSGPTVTQSLQFFEKVGLLREGEEMPSSGGRKPRLIEFCYDAFNSVGVEIRRHHIDIRVIDLKGRTVGGAVHELLFSNSAAYWQEVNRLIRQHVIGVPGIGQILGVAVAFPGEISRDRDKVLRATVLGHRDIPLNLVQENLDFPVRVEYGANAAGFGAVWRSSVIENAVYVIVTANGVAGSIILDNAIYSGTSGKPGAFGHIVLEPGGKPCFCGGRGCWSAYCSLAALTGGDGSDLAGFFSSLDVGNVEAKSRWEEYLDHFAQALANIFLSFDTDVIIGGKLAPYLVPWQEELKRRVRAYPVLAGESHSIRLDTRSESPMAEGAALTLVASFLNGNLDGFRFDQL